MNINAERRQFERFLFSSESNVTVKLNLFDGEDSSVVANITNLSEEGLGLNFRSNLLSPLCEGDWAVLIKIEGLPELRFLVGIEIKLKWIISYNSSRGAPAGCVFDNISPVIREQIKQFICTQIGQNLSDKENLEPKMATY